ADAILIQDGRGKGHIMLFLEYDRQNSDNIIVYEQNVVSSKPYEPIPTARKDVRSKTDLIKAGYFPIRLLPAR
ncbi:MAG: hypothetical protein Q8930_20790, partial [Bacillota bacterium]|nr:hypothetical protein [Bacillota bacterium]